MRWGALKSGENMIKIFDRNGNFLPIFRYPCLIIADNGLIYEDTEYSKLFPTAIGKIEFLTGKIYGRDYYKIFPTVIGLVKEVNGTYEIYGKDYYKSFSYPIGFIRDGKYYTAKDYYSILGTPSYYIE